MILQYNLKRSTDVLYYTLTVETASYVTLILTNFLNIQIQVRVVSSVKFSFYFSTYHGG